jgi:maltose alpha-D-glucosyltransferase/alpha-amylase
MRVGRIHGRLLPADGAEVPETTPLPIARTAPEQSNTSIIFGWQVLMKMFRRLEEGPNPDVEVGSVLTARGFTRVPPLVGALSYERPSAEPASVAMFQRFFHNQGNGWRVTIDEMARYFDRVRTLRPEQTLDEPTVADVVGAYLSTAELLGRRTGELHASLAADTDDAAFAPEPVTRQDLRGLMTAMSQRAGEQLRLLEAALPTLDPATQRPLAEDVLSRRQELLERFEELRTVDSPAPGHRGGGGGLRIRCHGDYHLGQVLITEADIMIIDFEGEPARPLAERRAKVSPLRDVAGMLRSFSYAAATALEAAALSRPDDRARLAPWADTWERLSSNAFRRGYMGTAGEGSFLPSLPDDVSTLLQAFVMDKALYELGYELNNRPDWVQIPLRGLLSLAGAGGPVA